MARWQKRTLIALAATLVVALALMGGMLVPSAARNHTELQPAAVIYREGSSPFDISSYDPSTGDVTVSGTAGIEVGSVLVAGVTDATPEGMLRAVTAISENPDGSAVLTTRPAALTEAIRRCDVSVRATPQGDGYDVRLTDNLARRNPLARLFGATQAKALDLTAGKADGPFFEKEWEYGSASADFEIEVDLSIRDGHVVFRSVAHPTLEATLGLSHESSWSAVEYPEDDGDGKITLFDKPLRPLTFTVGTVPVVITNQLTIDMNLGFSVEATLASVSAVMDRELGFEYVSGQGITPVNEDNSHGPDISLTPSGPGVSLGIEAGIGPTLAMRLYGTAGPDLSALLDLDMDAEASYTDKDGEGFQIPGVAGSFTGSFHSLLTLPISGHVTFEVPFNVFDGDQSLAVDVTLFDTGDTITLGEIDLHTGGPELTHTYRTSYQEKHPVELSGEYVFDYPDGWKVEDVWTYRFSEYVVLSNGHARVTLGIFPGDMGAAGEADRMGNLSQLLHPTRDIDRQKLTGASWDALVVEAGPAQLSYADGSESDIPSDHMTKMGNVTDGTMVARISPLPAEDRSQDTLAVLPKSAAGTHRGIVGPDEELICGEVSMTCPVPEGGFTGDEEAEVLAILGSLRLEP